jgi:coniferyl-aldehyde dehydrogenase
MSPHPSSETVPALEALTAAFDRQRALRLHPPDLHARLASLRSLARLLGANIDPLCTAISKDFGGRSFHETQLLEIFPALGAIRHARRHLRDWMRPQRRATASWFLPGRSRVVFQPLGVVGIVVPWNYPLYLAVAPLVCALAAGNRALVKMSETAPATAALFAKLVASEFDPAVLSVVQGDAEIGRRFAALPLTTCSSPDRRRSAGM